MLKSLVKDSNTNLIIFGEANFTFSLALSAIRQSWQGVVSTRFEELSKENPRPLFNDIKEECIHFCCKNGQKLNIEPAVIHKYVAAIEMVQPPPQDNWIFGIDAINTPWSDIILPVKKHVIWFQCPWIPYSNSTLRSLSTAKLIQKFLLHMSMKQNEGEFLLLGITKQFPYVKSYNLEGLLGHRLSRAMDTSGRYNFLGGDSTFIIEILKHGYHHTTCHEDKSIHEKIISDHIILVFQRNDQCSTQTHASSS